ncbi:MAG: TonB-dependent receptor plug domain-containing protein, partial [Candidatus Nitrotoga sp.]
MARKHADIQTRCNHRQTKLAIAMNSALICFGVATISLSGAAVAQSNIVASTTVQTYNISAGALQTALILFVKQADVKVFTDPALLSGKTTQGLKGNYTAQDGLKHLFGDSGLQAVPQGKGYLVQKLQIAQSDIGQAEKESTLPTITVSAKVSTGYTVPKISSATKTNTLLRDVPQSVSVVTKDIIKDQAIQSMAETVRYVPGMGISQGEGNRDALVFRGNRSTADFFVDGIRDDVQYYRDLYNIER